MFFRFFFFRKLRNCEISEEDNAKRASEPSKTSHFRIDFSLSFHVFSEPPSRGHFWRVQAPVYTQLIHYAYAHAADPINSLRQSRSATLLSRRPYVVPTRCRSLGPKGTPGTPPPPQENPPGTPKGPGDRWEKWGQEALWGYSEVVPNGWLFRMES